jgi:hypothetical protein
MKMANQWLKQLKAYDDTVDYEYDSFAKKNCLYTPSPYFNWIFANKSHGIPKNSSILMYSEQKSGKSLAIYAMIKQMQQDDKEGIAIYFNTEMRGQLQFQVIPGIDQERLIIYDTNDATEIFDRIENFIKPMIQDGMPLRIIAIDSLTKIMGTKRAATDSVANHLMGDHAQTVQNGLSKLVPLCKRNKILLIGTSQVRANMDAGPYGPKEKMAESWDTRHTFEYFISLKRAGAADDKQDIEGKSFEEDNIQDARGNGSLTGHKIYAKMEQSSIGTAGRAGVFTLDYKDGIINQHEEIFFLGKNTGIITTPNNRTYTFNGQSFNGKKECALAIKNDPKLAEAILTAVKKLDEK